MPYPTRKTIQPDEIISSGRVSNLGFTHTAITPGDTAHTGSARAQPGVVGGNKPVFDEFPKIAQPFKAGPQAGGGGDDARRRPFISACFCKRFLALT